MSAPASVLSAVKCAALFVAAPLAAQQEHPFIESFTVTVLEGRILVAWTMKGGATCDGSEVERSIDGVNFQRVHRLEGICGDAALDVPFTWYDTDPPELSMLHYRIRLGFNDGYSSVRSVYYDQLHSTDIRVFPIPSNGPVTLVVNTSAGALMDLQVFTADGRMVLDRAGLVGRRHDLDLSGLPAGVYRLVATSEGRRYTGGIVLQ